MQQMDEWHLFQNFVLGLLPHDGYTDVRHSAVRNDFGRDGVALTPKGESCFVAVSFDCSLTKIKKDAKRWTEDPNRKDAKELLFITWKRVTETKLSEWRAKIKKDFNLELRIIQRDTIAATAIREGVWRETCSRLGIPGHRAGYLRVSPYNREVVRRGLRARPPEWLSALVRLKEWDKLSDTVTSRLILGKPGAGKTTTLFTQLELAEPNNVIVVESDLRESAQIEGLLDDAANGGVIVFDDLQDNADTFVKLCAALLARKNDTAPSIAKKYKDVVILAASRSQEWANLRPKLPMTLIQDLKLLDGAELELTGLTEGQCARLIEICRDEWQLKIEKRLLTQAATEAAKRDATPLYVISMLAPARAKDDRTLKDEHLAGLPNDVLGLWERYWKGLDTTKRGFLRLIKLFLACKVEPHSLLLADAAKAFEITPSDPSDTLEWLELALWITRNNGAPTCLDVQIEVITIEPFHYDTWDSFVHAWPRDNQLALQLHNRTGAYYLEVRRARTLDALDLRAAIKAAANHFEAVGALGEDDASIRAMSLNNASACYSDLAKLEETRDKCLAWLDKAVVCIEEAARIYRDLGLHANLASSLNNASNRHGDLAKLEETRDKRRARFDKAVAYIEKAIKIRRDLGLRAELASSLNNASNSYSDLAKLEESRDKRRARLDKAVACIEKAASLYRDLGLRADLAMSLNNASNYYSDLAGLEETRDKRRVWLDKAVACIEGAAQLYRDLGLRADLAISLNNASRCYSNLAELEETSDKRREQLEKAVECIEEAIKIHRDLALHADLAASLNNASNNYRDLAELEETTEARRKQLILAAKAVEEAIRLHRELGNPESLALALGSATQHHRSMAEAVTDAEEAGKQLSASLKAIDEAVELFRNIGNVRFLIMALKDNVIAHMLLDQVTHELDVDKVVVLCDEGIGLAQKMENADAVQFFKDAKEKLTTG